jgi:hypothetical protein
MERTAYHVFRVPKRRGGWREIAEPNPELKEKQRAILRWLMARRIAPSPYAHAFVVRRSIVTNARPHVGKQVIVRIDLQDFFPSIEEGHVRQALVNEAIAGSTAREIAWLCTIDGRLPQGAPTSPVLSNLVFKPLDYRFAGLARKWDDEFKMISYTRYSDDLTFSGNHPRLNLIIHPVREILTETGFRINRQKTLVLRRSNRQSVTGVVVNSIPNIGRDLRHRLRGMLHRLKMMLIERKPVECDLPHVQGLIAHIGSINPAAARPLKAELQTIKMLLDAAAR